MQLVEALKREGLEAKIIRNIRQRKKQEGKVWVPYHVSVLFEDRGTFERRPAR